MSSRALEVALICAAGTVVALKVRCYGRRYQIFMSAKLAVQISFSLWPNYAHINPRTLSGILMTTRAPTREKATAPTWICVKWSPPHVISLGHVVI